MDYDDEIGYRRNGYTSVIDKNTSSLVQCFRRVDYRRDNGGKREEFVSRSQKSFCVLNVLRRHSHSHGDGVIVNGQTSPPRISLSEFRHFTIKLCDTRHHSCKFCRTRATHAFCKKRNGRAADFRSRKIHKITNE